MNKIRDKSNPTTLSVTVVVAAIAVFMAPGSYGVLSIIISFILISFIFCYELPKKRTEGQRILLSCVFSFSVLPAIGFIMEVYHNPVGIYNSHFDNHSKVNELYLLIFWLIFFLLFYAHDKFFIKRCIQPMYEIKKFEFEKAYESMRFFLDYRLKVFGFFLTANGLLIAAVFVHANDSLGKVAFSLLAFVMGLIICFIDKRLTYLAHNYRKIVIRTASDIGAYNLHGLYEKAINVGISHTKLFNFIVKLVIVAWFLIFIIFLLKAVFNISWIQVISAINLHGK
ncbi:MAG: hypothetical protein MRK00_16560 [Nitrosomonas sp.]|nr:hypothetical protein [Nitrosomonas sp.]